MQQGAISPASRTLGTERASVERRRALALIQRYYDETVEAYLRNWSREDNLAVHLGLSDSTVYSHIDALARTNEYLASMTRLSSEMTVVDAGCGFGASVRWLVQTYGCRAVGVNVSMSQLAIGKPARRNESMVADLVCGDFHTLPLISGSCDIVWAIESVVHSYNRERLWAEVRRVLKPEGVLLVAETFSGGAEQDDDLSNSKFRDFARGWRLFSVVTWERNRAMLERAGLAIVRTDDLTRMVLPSARILSGMCRNKLREIDENAERGDLTSRQYLNIVAGAKIHDLLESGFLQYAAYSAVVSRA